MKEDKLSFTILRYSALTLLHQGIMRWPSPLEASVRSGSWGWWWWKGSDGGRAVWGAVGARDALLCAGGSRVPSDEGNGCRGHQRYQHWWWGWRSGSSAGLLCGRSTGTMFRLSCPWGFQRSGREAMSWRGRRAEANWRRALWPLFYPMFQYPDLWSPVSVSQQELCSDHTVSLCQLWHSEGLRNYGMGQNILIFVSGISVHDLVPPVIRISRYLGTWNHSQRISVGLPPVTDQALSPCYICSGAYAPHNSTWRE